RRGGSVRGRRGGCRSIRWRRRWGCRRRAMPRRGRGARGGKRFCLGSRSWRVAAAGEGGGEFGAGDGGGAGLHDDQTAGDVGEGGGFGSGGAGGERGGKDGDDGIAGTGDVEGATAADHGQMEGLTSGFEQRHAVASASDEQMAAAEAGAQATASAFEGGEGAGDG